MIDESGSGPSKGPTSLVEQVGVRAARKLKARSDQNHFWFGLGMMGLIGWSVVIPTMLGAGLGLWLDARHPGRHGWTLAMLIAGLALGCANAWHWVTKEDKAMQDGNADE